MLTHQRPSTTRQHDQEESADDNELNIREIHALTPPPPPPPPPSLPLPPPPPYRPRSSSLSVASTDGENFTTMSREFTALVLAGTGERGDSGNLERIGEEETPAESDQLAIVGDGNLRAASPARRGGGGGRHHGEVTSMEEVKKGEVESKVSAWQNVKMAKINSRFKRDDAIINGWENEQIQKSSTWMKKVERKLEAKRARAMEKMENNIAKARQKAEERRATAEAKRGTKIARVLEVANLMRAVGRAPAKRSFF